jgi:hypothetical protein
MAALGLWALDSAGARSADPKIPHGSDPGGVPVAIVGRGVDYTRKDVAALLARDGEGDAIAWDVADGDPRPFPGPAPGDEALAGLLAGGVDRARLVVVRMPVDMPPALAPALQFVARTPARIVLLVPPVSAPIPIAPLADAARRLPGHLLVVPARLVVVDAVAARAGLLVVAGFRPADGGVAGRGADVAVPLAAGSEPAGLQADDVAAVRVAALATRIIGSATVADGAELRARVLALARRDPGGAGGTPAGALILDALTVPSASPR